MKQTTQKVRRAAAVYLVAGVVGASLFWAFHAADSRSMEPLPLPEAKAAYEAARADFDENPNSVFRKWKIRTLMRAEWEYERARLAERQRCDDEQ